MTTETKTATCSACGKVVPTADLASVMDHDTGGEVICLACHREICSFDPDLYCPGCNREGASDDDGGDRGRFIGIDD